MDDTPKPKKIKNARKLAFYLLIIGFICILISGVLGLQIFGKVGHRPPPMPRETNVSLIQDWMTLPYISRTYGVPQEVLFEKLNIDREKFPHSSLSQISSKTNINVQVLIDNTKNIINDFQSSHKNPPIP